MDILEPDYHGPDVHKVRLFNEWQPALTPGAYSISAVQDVSHQRSVSGAPQSDTVQITKNQEFKVVFTPFQLDAEAINSFYPPANRVEDSRTLPHIVFNDPHLPWTRNLALLVFKRDDLFLPTGSSEPVQSFTANAASQHSDGTFTLAWEQYKPLGPDYGSTINQETSKDQQIKIILPLLEEAKNVLGDDLDILKKFSHVRMVNPTDMPSVLQSRSWATFSAVVSPNYGPLDAKEPTEMFVHLVSLDAFKNSTISNVKSKRLPLVSLFSWSYKCDNESRNILALRKLVEESDGYIRKFDQPWKADDGLSVDQKMLTTMQQRLSRGYGLSPWRLLTGERFLCLLRGSLSPQPLPKVPIKTAGDTTLVWPESSNTGEDYQILDAELMLQDLTYSAAWHLGRTQAIADHDFAASMHRLRSLVSNRAASTVLNRANGIRSGEDLTADICTMVSAIGNLGRLDTGPATRIPVPVEAPVVTIADPNTQDQYHMEVAAQVTRLAVTNYDTGAIKVSPDLRIVFNFLMDRLHLKEIPMHYQLPNPTICPLESMRVLHIDDAYLDCVIDGALSIANHSGSREDVPRRAIKRLFNEFIRDKRVPRVLIIINSFLVAAVPDLKIGVSCKKIDNDGKTTDQIDKDKNVVLSYTRSDDTTLRLMVACDPGSLASVSITLPAHQLHFSLPIDTQDPSKLAMLKLEDVNASKPRPIPSSNSTDLNRSILCKFPRSVIAAIKNCANAGELPPIPDAATMAYQLTAHGYQVDLEFKTANGTVIDQEPRQIYPAFQSVRAMAFLPRDQVLHISTQFVASPKSDKDRMPEVVPSEIAIPSTSRIESLDEPIPILLPPNRSVMESLFNLEIRPRWISREDSDPSAAIKATKYTFEPLFLISRNNKPATGYRLHSFDVYVPSASEQARTYPGATTSTSSAPFFGDPGQDRNDVSMLRNPRWVPRLSYNTTWTRIRLLQRGGTGEFESENDGETRIKQVKNNVEVERSVKLDEPGAANLNASFKVGRRSIVDEVKSTGDRSQKCTIMLVERYVRNAVEFAYAFSTTTIIRSPNEALEKTAFQ